MVRSFANRVSRERWCVGEVLAGEGCEEERREVINREDIDSKDP